MGTRTYRVLSIDLYYYSSVGQTFCNFSSVARATRSGRGCLAIEKARFRRAERGEGEDRTKRTRLERFFCVAAPVIRSNSPPTTRADCFSFLSSLPVSRRPTFSIAQSVVYLAFISISHGPPPPPQPTEVLSSIPFLRTRVSRVAEQTWLKNYSSNYNYPETKLSRH